MWNNIFHLIFILCLYINLYFLIDYLYFKNETDSFNVFYDNIILKQKDNWIKNIFENYLNKFDLDKPSQIYKIDTNIEDESIKHLCFLIQNIQEIHDMIDYMRLFIINEILSNPNHTPDAQEYLIDYFRTKVEGECNTYIIGRK